MKPFYTLLLAFLMIACTPTDSAPTSADFKASNCELSATMNELNSLTRHDDVVDWIDDRGYLVCEQELYECIAVRHEISVTEFNSMANAHTDNYQYFLTWGQIENFIANKGITCYNKYVGFGFSGYSVSLRAVSFTNTESCYSRPLLEGIKRINNLSGTDKIYFIRGMRGYGSPATFKEVVLIRAGSSYYDLSDDPR